MVELLKETGSHLSMENRGLSFAASHADEASILHAESFMNVYRDRKVQPAPFELAGPWGREDPNADVTPERRVELHAALESVSAFPGA